MNHFKLALRKLAKNKTSSLIHLLGLTLGISACLAIFLIVQFELNFDRFHPAGERIYRVVGKFGHEAKEPNITVGFVPYALPQAMREEMSGLETVARFHTFESSVAIPGNGKPDKLFKRLNRGMGLPSEIVLAEPEYFDIFQYEWVAGNPQTALREPYRLVLSEKKARKYFGDLSPEDCIGKVVIYADSLQMSVSGIVRDWSEETDLTFTDFLSFSTISHSFLKNEVNLNEWNDLWSASQAFVKISENTTPAQIEAQFPAFAKTHFRETFKFSPSLQPLSTLHFDGRYLDNYSRKAHLPTLYGLMGIAAFILLLAAVNFVNLSTAQSYQRAKEIGIRKTLGSSRRKLIAQFLTETFLLTTAAVLLTLLVVPQAFVFLQSFLPYGLVFEMTGRLAVFLVAVAVVSALLAGLYPALEMSGFSPARVLKGVVFQKNGAKGRFRQSLIVFQFSVSLIFILGAMMVNRQIAFMRHKDLGFKSEAVLTLQEPNCNEDKMRVLYPKIQQLPGVEKAAIQLFEPMSPNFGLDRVTYVGKTAQTFEASNKMGDENYIPFYEMKILAGRNLLKSEEPQEMVITESFVKALGFQTAEEAIGQQLQWRERSYPIVGVVADFHQASMRNKILPTFITTTTHAHSIAVKLRNQTPGEMETTLAQIANLWASVYPNNEMEYSFLEDEIAKFYEKERKTSRMVNFATFLAIFVSCLGLYGLSIFSAERRTKEIGIRKVLGASVAGVTALLAKDFLKLVVIALAIASPIAYYWMRRWLAGFAYRIEISWWMFALAGILAVSLALLTVGFHSVRAALANPVKSLRSE